MPSGRQVAEPIFGSLLSGTALQHQLLISMSASGRTHLKSELSEATFCAS